MTLTNLHKAPLPYYGGKTHAAPLIWQALGDVPHFVDPFMGSLAAGFLRGGMAQQGEEGHHQAEERLWLSPRCLCSDERHQGLFDGEEGS